MILFLAYALAVACVAVLLLAGWIQSLQRDRAVDAAQIEELETTRALLEMKVRELSRDLDKSRAEPRDDRSDSLALFMASMEANALARSFPSTAPRFLAGKLNQAPSDEKNQTH